MAKGISINFLADVRDFLKGTKNVEDQLDDVADSLDVVAKEGEQSTEKLEGSFRELARAAKKSGDDIGDGMKGGFKKAEDGAQEFKDEANSTAKEAAASFDGSAESIVDAFQEVAANAFAGFGPAGAIAGLALAAGIGIATAEFTKSQEQAQKTKERIQELSTAFIETGSDTASLESFLQSLKDIVTESEDARKSFKDIQKEAKELGLDANALATAYAGGTDAIDGQIDAIEKLIKQESKQFQQSEDGQSSRSQAGLEHITQLQETQKELQAVADETKAAEEAEKAWLESGGAEVQAKADAIGLINDAYDEVVGSVTDFINAESGVLDVQAYLDAIDARQKALDDYQTSLANSGLSTDQKDALNAMGVEAASAWLKGYESATPEQQRKLRNSLTEASKENSGVARGAIEKAFEKPIEAKVQIDADTAQAQKDLDNLIQARTAIIKVDFRDREGRKIG